MNDTRTDAELAKWSQTMANPLTDVGITEQLSSCPGCPNWNTAVAELERARTRITKLEAQIVTFGAMLEAIIAQIDVDLAIEAEILDARVTGKGESS